ncbi:MAG: 4-hydroxy-tetrahydrodipicolinate reductase [Fibrobacteria bacterium]
MSPSKIEDAGSAFGGTARGAPESAAAVDIVVLGAKGRMGQMVLQACAQKSKGENPKLRVVGAVESPSSPNLGQKTGVDGIDVLITSELEPLLRPGVVVIDFTSPQVSLAALEAVRKKGAAHVLCTTGLSAAEKGIVYEAAKTVPIVMAPNMSIGVTLMFRVAEMVAKTLGEDFDVEIIEAHHHHKKDSPSGTALGFAEAVARGLGVELDSKANYGRKGMVGARPQGEIGIHAVRGGDIVGDHTVLYAGDGERIELKHMAHSRMTFAQGAVKAALFLAGKPSGCYDMFAVLGL